MSALRDAFLSALVALGLFAPLVGLVTTNAEHGLSLQARPLATAVVVLLVFFLRLLVLSWRGRTGRGVAGQGVWGKRIKRAGPYVTPLLLVAAVALPLTGSRYYIDLGTLVLTYIMLGWGLNIVVGLAGCWTLAMSRSTRWGRIPTRCWRRSSAWGSGPACRSPASWRRYGA